MTRFVRNEAKPGELHYAVITADVMNSRDVPSFQQTRDLKPGTLSDLHAQSQFTVSPYTVTAWDEFQVILRSPTDIADVAFDLCRLFNPMKLRIAIGIGNVIDAELRPINHYAGGEAFERARLAADKLKDPRSKYATITQFNSGDMLFDQIANTICHLQDTLLDGLSDKQ